MRIRPILNRDELRKTKITTGDWVRFQSEIWEALECGLRYIRLRSLDGTRTLGLVRRDFCQKFTSEQATSPMDDLRFAGTSTFDRDSLVKKR